jgi:hypothetical protein
MTMHFFSKRQLQNSKVFMTDLKYLFFCGMLACITLNFALCVVQCEEAKQKTRLNSILPAHMIARRKQERNQHKLHQSGRPRSTNNFHGHLFGFGAKILDRQGK